MTNRIDCRSLAGSLEAAASGTLAPELELHVRACSDCARLVTRECRLVVLLLSLPPAPTFAGEVPSLPPAAAARSLALPGWIAAAAAAAGFAAILWHGEPPGNPGLRIERVVDLAGTPPPVDERLLALTGGFEAVAMRRPTESR